MASPISIVSVCYIIANQGGWRSLQPIIQMLRGIIFLQFLTGCLAPITYHDVELPQQYAIMAYTNTVYNIDDCFTKCLNDFANANGATASQQTVSISSYYCVRLTGKQAVSYDLTPQSIIEITINQRVVIVYPSISAWLL